MRHLIYILVLILLTSVKLLACGDAYQFRLFPIGLVDSKIVVVETSLRRYWGPDTIPTVETGDRWKGFIMLKFMDKHGVSETIQIIDTLDFFDKNYVMELRVPFMKALVIAQSLPNFRKAEKQVIEFCNFNADCKLLDIKLDSTSNNVYVSLDRKTIEVKYPEIVIKEGEKRGGIFGQLFKINSIRQIKIGDYKLIVVDFAMGEDHETDFDTQIKNQKKCSSPLDCIYPEIVLHHGFTFDSIIWK